MINILFVCSGGTCRSAMANAIMKDVIKKKDLKQLDCSSGGLFVSNEIEMNEKAKIALKQLGVKVSKHKARQVDEDVLHKYDWILTMTNNQKMTILNKFPELATKVKSLKDFVGVDEIEDPYGKPVSTYYNVARILSIAIDKIVLKFDEKGVL